MGPLYKWPCNCYAFAGGESIGPRSYLQNCCRFMRCGRALRKTRRLVSYRGVHQRGLPGKTTSKKKETKEKKRNFSGYMEGNLE